MTKRFLRTCLGVALALFVACTQIPAQEYDLLLKGGHVIDAKNNIDAVRDEIGRAHV